MKVRLGDGLAQLLGANCRGECGNGRGQQPVDAADRGGVQQLRRASRTRVRGWAAADEFALLRQFGGIKVQTDRVAPPRSGAGLLPGNRHEWSRF